MTEREKDYIGYDARAWVDRLIVVNGGSKFTPSERYLIAQRLHELKADLGKPIPFVEAAHAR